MAQRRRYGIFTVMASAGQSTSHGVQYQHSSRAMYALPVVGLIASASSGQTSTQRWQPLMHASSLTITGTSKESFACAIEISSGSRRLRDRNAEPVIGRELVLVHGHDVWRHGPGQVDHPAVGALFEVRVDEPLLVVHRRVLGTVVVEPPAALGAEERRPRGHLGAIADEVDLHGPHEIVRVVRAHRVQIVPPTHEVLE